MDLKWLQGQNRPLYKYSVVVPVFNNAPSLTALFEALDAVRDQLFGHGARLELIFVDDGSADDSWQLLSEYYQARQDVLVVKLTRNFGAVQAARAGLSRVTGDLFSILPADLQDPPELLAEMYLHWQQGEKFVICVRGSRDDPLVTRLSSNLYYMVLRRFALPDFPAGGFDLALMDAQLLPALRDSSKNVLLPVLSFWLGFKPKVLRYHRRKRQHGRSGWTLARKLKALLDILVGFSNAPARLLLGAGLGVSVFAFGYGATVLVSAINQRIEVPGFASTVILLSFFSGTIILLLGVVGEYLWRILDALNLRPDSVVDFVLNPKKADPEH